MNPQDIRAVVVEHGGKSYIRLVVSHYCDEKQIAANGTSGLERAPGDHALLVFNGVVKTLEKIIPARRITTKYELREDLRGSAKTEVISVEQFQTLPDVDRSLYRAVHEDIPQGAEPIPFVTQTETGEPKPLPREIFCTDRNYFARFPSFWHLGPVRASARYVLYRLALRLDEIVGENPLIKWSSGWRRDPEIYIKDTVYTSFFIEVGQMEMNGIAVTASLKTMFTIDKSDRNLSYGAVLRPVDGDNLEDLERKVVAYLDELTKQHVAWAPPNACPCCKRRFQKDANPIKRKERRL